MQKGILVFAMAFFVMVWVETEAQSTDSIAYDRQYVQKEGFSDTINNARYFKLHLTAFFEYEPAFQFAYSYPLKGGKMQLQHELGYVTWNRTYYFWMDEEISYHGLRFRNQLRRYFLTRNEAMERKSSPDFVRSYVALDVMYKYGNIWQDREISRQNGAYFETVDFITHKHVAAAHLLVGWESQFLSGSDAIMDYYIGVGVRYKSIHSKFEDLTNEDLSPFFYDELDWPMSLSVMAGIRLGFRL